MTTTITPVQLAYTIAEYVKIVEKNEALQAVLDAEPVEIGWELVQTYEEAGNEISDDDESILQILINAGGLAQDLIRRTR